MAILEGAFPEMSHVADALNKLRDEITDRIAQASTPEEIEQLSKEIDELMSDYQKCQVKLWQKQSAWTNRVGDGVWLKCDLIHRGGVILRAYLTPNCNSQCP